MSFPTQCPATYSRSLPGAGAPTYVRCTYIEGHTSDRHSYETLKVEDDVERDRLRAERAAAAAAAASATRPPIATDLPPLLAELLRGVDAGDLDDYLELLLAAGHTRKLARRGVAGFPRLDRGATR